MLCVATVFIAPIFDPFFDALELEITEAMLMHAWQRPRVSIAAASIFAGNHCVKTG